MFGRSPAQYRTACPPVIEQARIPACVLRAYPAETPHFSRELGNFRWLAVGPANQPGVNIVLMAVPGEPVLPAETQQAVRELMAKGFAGTVFLTSDDIYKDYDELTSRGVEFVEKPGQRPYGIDSAFRDPSGNNIRIAQR